MASAPQAITIPKTPVPSKEFVSYLSEHPGKPVRELLKPFTDYEDTLRRVFATAPEHEEIKDPFANLVPLFEGNEDLRIRARNLETETDKEKQSYIMPLKDEERMKDGKKAIVDKQEFLKNFAIFSENALQNMDWSNVVAAGSSVLTPLLPVPEEHKSSKKGLREYYHNIIAPTSDVDLFIYGVDEEEAYKRMLQIEATVKDNLLWEVTSVRTRNTVTIVSRYPNRHIQIVLRLYKSVSEILTGFDVNCSCVAFDGKQVYASPRAVASLITQCSEVDLKRRSPSYEHRLAKYRSRGFEIYFPGLRREDIDPTIFERSFGKLQGLARLLVLEKLPTLDKREQYLETRRSERGNPKPYYMKRMPLKGDLKADAEVADWEVEDEEVSSYHTFTIPYGQMHNAKKTERLLYTKDMLLNAEWNKQAQKSRPAYLHRHPVFIGTIEEIAQDCCGFCPEPETEEEKELQVEDDKAYVRGLLRDAWLKDEPGRQEVGSFCPITEGDWTEMAYVGVNQKLFAAIVAEDVEAVKKYLSEEGYDPNRRDHVGRTPLQVACLCSSVEVVQTLIDHGARLISRMADGRTALHIAAARGEEAICRALLTKSEENEAKKNDLSESEEEEHKVEKKAKETEKDDDEEDDENDDESDDEDEDYDEVESNPDTTASFITGTDNYMKKKDKTEVPTGLPEDPEDEDEDIIEIDTADWINHFTPLHYAIVGCHPEVVRLLVSDFGSDVLLPVKLVNDWDGSARAAILTLALVLSLPTSEQRTEMAALLLSLGATTAQADLQRTTILDLCIQKSYMDVLKVLLEKDKATAGRIVNLIRPSRNSYYNQNNDSSSLITAIRVNEEAAMLLLEHGAKPSISLEEWFKARNKAISYGITDDVEKSFLCEVEQPIIVALYQEAISVVLKLLDLGADPSTVDKLSYSQRIYDVNNYYSYNSPAAKPASVLNLVRRKLELVNKELEKEEDKPASTEQKPNEDLEPLDVKELTSSYESGSYEEWAATILIKNENERRKYVSRPGYRAPGFHNGFGNFIKEDEYEEELEEEEVEKLTGGDQTATLEEIRKQQKEKRRKSLQEMQDLLEKTEKLLLEKGAKEFKDIFPDKVQPEDTAEPKARLPPAPYNPETPQQKKWEANIRNITVNYSKTTPQLEARYLELFKAVWDGDKEKVKSLCFPRYDPAEKNKEKNKSDDTKPAPAVGDATPLLEKLTIGSEQPASVGHVGFSEPEAPSSQSTMEAEHTPLLISAFDSNEFNAFSIACHRKHSEEFLEFLLNIAEIQYEPSQKNERNVVYTTGGFHDDDSDDDSDSDSEVDPERVQIMERLVDEEYTMDVLASAVDEVKAKEDAFSTMIRLSRWDSTRRVDAINTGLDETAICVPAKGFCGGPMVYAVLENDLKMVKFLLRMAESPAIGRGRTLGRLESPFSGLATGNQANDSYEYLGPINIAMKLGRIDILKEFIRYEGLGLDHHEEKEAKKADKPKFYQGINVNGKKRKDWAASANPNANDYDYSEGADPILHYAAYHFNMQTIDWLMTPEPRMLLKEFGERLAKISPEDKRVDIIRNASDDKIKRWFGIGSELLLHISLLPSVSMEDDIKKTVRAQYWLDKYPDLLEITTDRVYIPPLFIAALKRDLELFKFLLEKGANPKFRDENGLNLLHYIINLGPNPKRSDLALMEEFLKAIPEDAIQSMFTQRGLLMDFNEPILMTPLSAFLLDPRVHYHTRNVRSFDKTSFVDMLNKYSKGADLHIRSGLGETPLHAAARSGNHVTLKKLLELGGDALLVVEDANGSTAMELADRRYFADVISEQDPQKDGHAFSGYRNYRTTVILVPFGDDRDRNMTSYRQVSVHVAPVNPTDEDKLPSYTLSHNETWEILKEATKKCDKQKFKRGLVKLHEVTEAAKRLTDPEERRTRQTVNRYRWRRRYNRRRGNSGMDDKEVEEEQPKSIFGEYLATLAIGNIPSLPLHLQPLSSPPIFRGVKSFGGKAPRKQLSSKQD